MTHLSAQQATTWPETILILGLLFLAIVLVTVVVASINEFRKLKISAARDDDQRQLVRRYEQLAENTLDAQQRMAADLSELRTRIASVEQILRTVE